MTDYTKSTNFASKDSLSTGNALKIVKGTELDAEFNNLVTAVATKANSLSPTFTGTPAAPTASAGTNTTQIATTAFVTTSFSYFTGAMMMWPLATAPTGFLVCDGTAVSRSTYAALFAVIGTAYGTGDGSTTFTLPNFKNRSPIGAGDLYAANAQVGSKDAVVVSHTHTFTGDALAAHSHSYNDTGAYAGGSGAGDAVTQGNSNNRATTSVSGGTPSGTISTAGVSGTDANLQPSLGVFFIIKT